LQVIGIGEGVGSVGKGLPHQFLGGGAGEANDLGPGGRAVGAAEIGLGPLHPIH
jgi:hypothetical protein